MAAGLRLLPSWGMDSRMSYQKKKPRSLTPLPILERRSDLEIIEAMAGYLIKTKSGFKGPFEVEQLQRLVDEGRISANVRVVTEDRSRAVVIAELLEAHADAEDWDLDDELDQYEEDYEESSRTAPRRGVTRRRMSLSERRMGGRRRPRDDDHYDDEYDRPYRYKIKKRSNSLAWALTSLLVVGLGVVLYVLWPILTNDYRGRWLPLGDPNVANYVRFTASSFEQRDGDGLMRATPILQLVKTGKGVYDLEFPAKLQTQPNRRARLTVAGGQATLAADGDVENYRRLWPWE